MQNRTVPRYVPLILFFTAANISILFIRNSIVGNDQFNFLLSNLLSGFVPILIAFLLQKFYHRLNNFFFWVGGFIWVLFYPNSPYMLSDLKHINLDKDDLLMNYDDLVILGIVLLSLMYGFVSLKIMFQLFRQKKGKRTATILIIISLLLSCLGFYIGRTLPLYSSDIFLHPIKTFEQIWPHIWPIGKNIYAYLLMALFGWIQFMLLWMFKDINDFESPAFSEEDVVHSDEKSSNLKIS